MTFEMAGNKNEQTGVNYGDLDPFKIAAQEAAATTSQNLAEYFGYHEIPESRGESAYVWYESEKYQAMVIEGLGTKNIAADRFFEELKKASQNLSSIANEVSKDSPKTYYDVIAQDTVAMIVNDLITVGAMPKVVAQHLSVADGRWFKENPKRARDLAWGWAAACNLAGATWGGGETPELKDILRPGVIELSGAAVGEINPPERLTLGRKLQAGDHIIYLPSSGIHANGLTDARAVADNLPEGYSMRLNDGSTYGETLLTPTPIYVNAVRSLFQAGVDIHYMANITGHGWRKLMRADRELTYVMAFTPENQSPVFDFIQHYSGKTDEEMYGTFNMGMGFAIFVSGEHLARSLKALQSGGWVARLGGHVEEGPRQVIIKPKNIVFEEDSLKIR